jgi:hypothetical protein
MVIGVVELRVSRWPASSTPLETRQRVLALSISSATFL